MLPTIELKRSTEILISIFMLGFTSVVTQVIGLREVLAGFYGNELVIGIFFAAWMLLTATGALLGWKIERSFNRFFPVLAQVVLGILPFLTILAFRLLRPIVFPVGTMIGFGGLILASFILLTPYCLYSGFLFTRYAAMLSQEEGDNRIAHSYGVEAIGSVVGGALFSLFAVFFLKTFQSIFLLMLLNFMVAWVGRQHRSVLSYLIFILTVAVIVGATSLFQTDESTMASWYPGQEMLFYKDTPYGNLIITKQANQINIFENNTLLASTHDAVTAEENVHYAMLQHRNPKNVLLVSGGLTGAIDEILKYDIDRIDYVEINPWLIEIGKFIIPSLAHPKVSIIEGDARIAVKRLDRRYDVVLLILPEPTTAMINRYYTVEFYTDCKQIMRAGAVLSTSLLASVDYYGLEARKINSTAVNTLRSVFANVQVITGLKNYWIASDDSLSRNIAALASQRNIPTVYVNGNYLDDVQMSQRSDEILHSVQSSLGRNRDFNPICYVRQIMYWLSYYNISLEIITIVFLLLVFGVIAWLQPVNIGMFTTGFASTSAEFLLIIVFQIIYGYVYQITGVLITLFMAGLAFGAFLRRRLIPHPTSNHYILFQSLIGVCVLFFPLIFAGFKAIVVHEFIVQAGFYVATFVVAALSGCMFALATELGSTIVARTAGERYGIDLLGAALGAFLCASVFIPLAGIAMTCYIVGGLCFFGAMVAKNKMKRIPAVE